MSSASSDSSSQFDAVASVLSPAEYRNGSAAVDECLAELGELAQTEQSPQSFYAALLERALAVFPAVGAAIWQCSPGNEPRLIRQLRFPPPLLARHPTGVAQGQQTSPIAVAIPAYARASALIRVDHPYPWPLVVCPFSIEQPHSMVLEIALSEDTPVDVQSGGARLAGVMAEIAADFHRRRELARLREREASAARFVALVGRLHAQLDPAATAYTIANEGRQWIGCDRVVVLRMRRGSAATLAVSAVDRIDRRSGQIVLLERLASAVGRSGEPLLWQEAASSELAPELAEPLHAYLDASHARHLAVVPLPSPRVELAAGERDEPLGMLVAESYSAERSFDALVERTGELARLAAPAMANALAHHELPLLGLQTRLARWLSAISRRPVAAALVLAVILAVVALLLFVPADFDVEVQGTLQPLQRKNLFAPSDGVVEEVIARHGQQVARGDVLLRMRSPALDLDESRLTGELQTAQARLAAVRSLQSGTGKSADAGNQDRLASEELQLSEQIKSLEKQLAIVHKWRSELTLASPVDGIVLTWNAEQSLSARPVKAGQVLLTLADAASPWVLELQLPDRPAGHVLTGQRGAEGQLPVAFLLASDPAVTYHGQLQSVALAGDASSGQSEVEATVAVNSPLPEGVRAGTRVTARIDCGRRSIGYVWLHDVIDFFRTFLFF